MASNVRYAFYRGEITPELNGRMDRDWYTSALSRARNGVVKRFGGIENRGGLVHCAPVRYQDKFTRLVRFKFGDADTHVLEFGDSYLRVMREGEHVYDITKTISGATKASPCVVTTSTAHGLASGDEVCLKSVGGMVELEGRRCLVTVLSSTTFSLTDAVTGAAVNSAAFTTFTSGGTVNRVYTVASPYAAADLPYVRLKQVFDVIKLTCKGYPHKKLVRYGLTNWAFEDVAFTAGISGPTGLTATTSSAGSETYRYAITATSSDTGEESLPGTVSASSTITAVTKANPAVVTLSAAPGWETGHEIAVASVVGMTELNGRRFRVTKLTATTYQLQDTDSTGYSAYVSGGTATAAFVTLTSAAKIGTSGGYATVSWSAVTGASQYDVYREKNGVFGYLGTTSNTTFRDEGDVAPDTSDAPPFYRNPFFGTNNEPLAVGRYQQRTVYGGTPNAPNRLEFSKIGVAENLSTSNPIKSDDAFSVDLDVEEYSEVRHILTGRDLMVFLSSALVIIQSTSDSGFSFTSFKQSAQSDKGITSVPPLSIGGQVLYNEEGGNRVNAVQYRFTIDGYTPEDVSVMSAHLFQDDYIVAWDFLSWPEPLVLAVTNLGKVLCFTFAPQEDIQVKAWTWWDTEGVFESVAVVREKSSDRGDTAYFVVNRPNGKFIEALSDRKFDEVDDCVFLDSASHYEDALTIENAAGDTYTITAHGWSDGDTVQGEDRLVYTVSSATTNTFVLSGSGYAVGGVLRRRFGSVGGLHQLRGTEVTVLADGNVVRGLTVSSDGVLTLPFPTARVSVGLSYSSEFATLPLANVQLDYFGRNKRVSKVELKLYRSRGFTVSVDGGPESAWKQREFEAYGEPTQLFTGDTTKNLDLTTGKLGIVTLKQDDPLPLSVLAINIEAVSG